MSYHDFSIAKQLSELEKRKAEEWDQLYEEIDRLRAEVNRRGEMLRRCLPMAQARVIMLDKFPRNPENIEAGEGARELVKEIEALTDD